MATDYIKNVGFYDSEQAEIARRRKWAEMLMQQGQAPLGPTETVGGWAVKRSPMEGIGKMAQAFLGGYASNDADKRQKALAERIRQERQQDYQTLAEAQMGRPAVPPPTDEAGGGPYREAVQPSGVNPALIAQLRSPEVQQLAAQQMMEANKPRQIGSGGLYMPGGQVVPPAMRPQGAQSIGAGGLRLPDGTIIPPVQKPAKAEGKWSEPYQMGGAWVQKNDLTGQIRQSVAREPRGPTVINAPAVTPVTIQDPNDPNSTIVIDGRTKQVLGKGPKLTDTGKMETKRQFAMQGIGATIKQAEDILSGKGGKALPTQSGAGTAYDYAASVVGVAPEGAAEADQLRSIGASLVSKMPRMEGPQSDKDVALYKEAAGRVGDSTLPISRRKAALETVKELFTKYERLNPDAFEDRRTDQPPPGAVRPR